MPNMYKNPWFPVRNMSYKPWVFHILLHLVACLEGTIPFVGNIFPPSCCEKVLEQTFPGGTILAKGGDLSQGVMALSWHVESQESLEKWWSSCWGSLQFWDCVFIPVSSFFDIEYPVETLIYLVLDLLIFHMKGISYISEMGSKQVATKLLRNILYTYYIYIY